jgi:phosphoserine phosphatase
MGDTAQPSAKEILLINIAGHDRPGLTSSVTAILADYGVNILDIGQAVIHDTLSLGLLVELNGGAGSSAIIKDIFGQAVIHDTLSLGLLVELNGGAGSSAIIKDILYRTHELDLQARFTPIAADDYTHWVSGQGKPRHIITLLARRISAEHIAKVTAIVSHYGLNIDRIDRLSGRVNLDDNSAQNKSSVELSLRGAVENISELRQQFMQLASELDIDIAYQEDSIFRRVRRLVCFDMDSTLIEAEVIDELAKAAGVGAQVAEITERAMRGELDFTQSFSERVALLKGLDENVLSDIANKLRITEGAETLVSTLKKLGYKTAILSGGFNYFGRFLQQKLGIDYVYANELEIVNGKVTGNVVGTVVDGKRKAELLKELAAKEGITLEQVIAVGDGANDLPMLSIAGLGIAFRAKPIVKESAKQSISTLGLDGILYLLGLSDRHTH